MKRASFASLLASMALVGALRAQDAGVRSVRSEEIQWKQHPALAAGAMRAVVWGDPTKPGLYATRLHSPSGLKIMPHTHPEDRIYTVISGTLYLGVGDTYDESKLVAYPQGTVVFVPAKLSHYQFAKADGYEIQISGMGPTDINFLNPTDDLRRK